MADRSNIRSQQTREGLAAAVARGRFPGRMPRVTDDEIRAAMPMGTSAGAKKVGMCRSQFIVRRKRIEAIKDEH